MVGIVLGILKAIFLLGFLIFIHELGHFTVARLCKVKVDDFSIGFGPIIWQKQGKETKYEIRLIPLGGFVNMEGEEKRVDKKNSFSNASLPKRMAIVLAGPIVNIVFAIIVFYMLVLMQGTYVSNEIKEVKPNYAAEIAQIKPGDKILEIKGIKTNTGTKIAEILKGATGEELTIKIKRENEIKEVKVKPTEEKNKITGIYLDQKLKVIMIQEGSSAEKAGIKLNDKIIKINELTKEEIRADKDKLIKSIKENERTKIELQRKNETKIIEYVPDKISNYYLGISFKNSEDTLANRIIGANEQTKEFLIEVFESIRLLFTGKVGINQMMGPVGIGEAVANTDGINEFISMLALISISLGITNLLPIPALDGGKMVLLIIEGIRKKPMKEETEIKIQLIGFAILITIAIMVTYNDILRIK